MINSTEGSPLLDVRNGKIVRLGAFRLNVGDSAARYAAATASGQMDADCVFCPPIHQDMIGGAPEGFSTFYASAPYQYWDGQEVVEHRMVTPDEHVTELRQLGRKALRRLEAYLTDLQNDAPEGVTVQPYTRSANNPSKSVAHVHTHAFYLSEGVVSRLEYDLNDGLTILDFTYPTEEQIVELRHSRTQ